MRLTLVAALLMVFALLTAHARMQNPSLPLRQDVEVLAAGPTRVERVKDGLYVIRGPFVPCGTRGCRPGGADDGLIHEPGDVAAVVTRNKQARAFALGDALGDRDLPRLLRTLDEELWTMKFDSAKSEIGLLYGLITKVRTMLFLKEMIREGWIKADMDYNRFKAQLERVPAGKLPEDKRFNPLAMNPYVLYKALPHARRYSTDELIRAMELLLDCNQRLIFSTLDESLVLQQTLVQIVRGGGQVAATTARR